MATITPMSLYSRTTVDKPEVGMGATIVLYSDTHAATICEIINSKTVAVKRDKAKVIHGDVFSADIKYEYERNESAQPTIFTMRKGGVWISKGDSIRHGLKLMLGVRQEYYDPSF